MAKHKFSKKTGHAIPKNAADEAIKRWADKGHHTKSSFFGSDIIQKLLDEPGSVGIRIHYGLDELGYMQPILTSQTEESIDPETHAKIYLDGGKIMANASSQCPPYC